MGQHQSVKASSVKAPDRLEIYKCLLDLGFLGAQLSVAPSHSDVLEVLSGHAPKADLPLQPLYPCPKGEMNPHEAMEELERVVEIDDWGNVRLVGMPGIAPERYRSGGPFAYLARPEAKGFPRDHAYWKAYEFALDRYQTIYFGPRRKGAPCVPDYRIAKAYELHKRRLSHLRIGMKLGLPHGSKEEQQKTRDRVRYWLKLAKTRPAQEGGSRIDPMDRSLQTLVLLLPLRNRLSS